MNNAAAGVLAFLTTVFLLPLGGVGVGSRRTAV